MVICFLFFFCVVASSVTPAPPSDHDFELVYCSATRENELDHSLLSANITIYARQFLSDVWVTKLTVCSWVHTPDIGTS